LSPSLRPDDQQLGPSKRRLTNGSERYELTPTTERWRVSTEDYNESGRVYLELADATPAQAERGMAMLKKLVGTRKRRLTKVA
jgi:hypothetical protein